MQPYEQPLTTPEIMQAYLDLEQALTDAFLHLHRNHLPINRETILRYLNRESFNFIREYEKWMELQRKRLAPETIRTSHYQLLLRLKEAGIRKYERDEHRRFLAYLQQYGYSDNTIGRLLKRLKMFLRYLGKAENLSYIKIHDKPKSVVFLHEEEIRKIAESSLYPAVRDLFLCQCYTGLRYSDTQHVTTDNIDGNLLIFTQVKTGDVAYAPVLPELRVIMETYKGRMPVLSNQAYNRSLKKMAGRIGLNRSVESADYYNGKKRTRLVPLAGILSSHVARKTFVTLLLNKGYSIDDVMKFSGHKDFRSMKSYIGLNEHHLQELAGSLLINGARKPGK